MPNTRELELWRLVDKAFKNSIEKFGDIFAKDVTRDLLDNGVTVLPCKVGDTVYINGVMGVGRAEKHKVKYASYHNVRGKETWFFEADLVCDSPGMNDCGFCASAIGKTVFFTKEEAEAALPEPPKGD